MRSGGPAGTAYRLWMLTTVPGPSPELEMSIANVSGRRTAREFLRRIDGAASRLKLTLAGRQAAVDHEARADDEARPVGGEVQRGVGDVLGPPELAGQLA